MPLFTPGPNTNFKRWVNIYKSDKFICMTSMIGFHMAVVDPESLRIYLPPDATDLELGDALSRTLDKSRIADPLRHGGGFHRDVRGRLYDEWISEVKARYGYRSKAQLMRETLYCMVRVTRENVLMIEPYKRVGQERVAFDHEDSIYLPWKSPKAAIGAALRRAFSLCS
jgi:hypothetical protein